MEDTLIAEAVFMKHFVRMPVLFAVLFSLLCAFGAFGLGNAEPSKAASQQSTRQPIADGTAGEAEAEWVTTQRTGNALSGSASLRVMDAEILNGSATFTVEITGIDEITEINW